MQWKNFATKYNANGKLSDSETEYLETLCEEKNETLDIGLDVNTVVTARTEKTDKRRDGTLRHQLPRFRKQPRIPEPENCLEISQSSLHGTEPTERQTVFNTTLFSSNRFARNRS